MMTAVDFVAAVRRFALGIDEFDSLFVEDPWVVLRFRLGPVDHEVQLLIALGRRAPDHAWQAMVEDAAEVCRRKRRESRPPRAHRAEDFVRPCAAPDRNGVHDVYLKPTGGHHCVACGVDL